MYFWFDAVIYIVFISVFDYEKVRHNKNKIVIFI